MKKVAILLPGPRREPVGGYKVLYQYGDYLASTGWSVDFIYLSSPVVCYTKFSGFSGRIKSCILARMKFYSWFDFTSANISHRVKTGLSQKVIDEFDIIICSSVETFIYASEISKIEHKKIVYFVQDYENWNVSVDVLNKTLSYKDIDYITISNDLKNRISDAGGTVVMALYNGVNKNDFFITTPWKERTTASFLFLYHPGERKGCSLLLDALEKAKELNYSLNLSCFSAYPKPSDFPAFIKYYYQPSVKELNKIYNENKYFICSSIYEGFGLTPAEAAFCGEVIITTKNGGVEQYVKDGETGFILRERTRDSFISAIMHFSQNEKLYDSFSTKSSASIKENLDFEKNLFSMDTFLSAKYRNLRA
jgi:Glycosyltransferase